MARANYSFLPFFNFMRIYLPAQRKTLIETGMAAWITTSLERLTYSKFVLTIDIHNVPYIPLSMVLSQEVASKPSKIGFVVEDLET